MDTALSTPHPRTGIYAGSFDPYTIGHHDIALRALEIVDRLIIVVGINRTKQPFLSVEERVETLRRIYAKVPAISIVAYEGLTGAFAQAHGASLLIRGIRNVADMEYERNMAEFNRKHFNLETVLLLSAPELCSVSSSLVRELASFGEPYEQYLPQPEE